MLPPAPPAPPEVAGAAPPAWFPWVGLAAGAVLGLVGLVWLLRVLPRLRRARSTTGTVVEVGRRTANRGQFLWHLVVDYAVVDGAGAGQVRRGEWVGQSSLDHTAYAPGMRLPVRYDPVSGAVVDLPGGGRPPAWLVPAVLLVVGPLVGGLFWVITG
ncbi:DUF3592 domain-containing protein [Aquipuribacter hungaricus]|uniref:DUF3592 domain-containing protein n=2 Tax=Aquipuribacter hungaricus TaxID=545624 RepID=A0ABV7WIS9_9MICO